MKLLDLHHVLRKAGLAVIEVEGWQGRGHGEFKSIESIGCHHTAGPKSGNMPSLRVVRDGRPGLRGPLCNIALGRDGTCYVVSAGVAYHAGSVKAIWMDNWHCIGIEAEGTGTDSWPRAQYDAYVRLCAALSAAYGVPTSRVLGHKEICSPAGRKIDPNFDMHAFRRAVAAFKPSKEKPVSKSTSPFADHIRAALAELRDGRALTKNWRKRIAIWGAIKAIQLIPGHKESKR